MIFLNRFGNSLFREVILLAGGHGGRAPLDSDLPR